ncbi:MAG: PQQ-dependent sugar dehydrogenase [Acetobacteraceae bacterium]
MRSQIRHANIIVALSGFLLGGTMLAPVALAQATPQPAAQAAAPGKLPPGDPLIGRPESPAAAKLAPVNGPVLPTPADRLPLAKMHVPDGFKVEVFATGMADARSMRVGDKGTVFVGSRLRDKVYAVVPGANGNTVKVIASGLHRPNGVAFHDGSLFVAELSKIWRFDNIEANLDNPPKPVLIYEDLPTDEPHGWKFIGIGPDNKLYVPIGAPGNIVMPPPSHAQIRRMDLDGKNVELVATGVRNSVGFDWQPGTKDFYFSNNGRDWLSEDIPNDTLHLVKAGTTNPPNFGYPYCHQGNFTDPEFGWGHSCSEFAKPAGLMGPHVATLGMRFYTGDMFPSSYKNAIFLARHGSWDRTEKLGGDVVVVKLKEDGTVGSIEPFMTGFLENNNYVGRPVDVQMLKDGSLLVSDDWNGAIWRVSYNR